MCLTVAMSDNSEEPEVELYEEVIGDEYCNSPVRDQTSSVVPVASALAKGTTLHGPTFIIDGSRRPVEATETFTHAPRPRCVGQLNLEETKTNNSASSSVQVEDP